MTYRTTRQADQDIIDIYFYGCRQFGVEQAERYHEGLAAILDLIAHNPYMARERPEFTPPVRLYPYRSHLIVYRLDDAGVLVVRILHGRQDWGRHL